ncbi:MAG: tRNA (adenosine(37)-N6)-dimethylallyltransferase MiaA, partial [Boseongicola sp.]|nr:tRNA (adenosine(37)-N6)-dimethylallyltransferase MiaA [Boseongicola sp.]
MDWIANTISGLTPKRPVLIAGPTASGKSALALAIAERFGGTIINADAIQVYSDWRVLTARPSDEDEARAPHALYGHVGGDIAYSVGHWLRDIRPLLSQSTPIIVGGTGLYFAALTEGLADIPAVPSEIHTNARSRIENGELVSMIAELDAETRARIDLENPMRVQRAWEVLQSSGKGLAKWQDETPPADLPLDAAQALVVNGPVDWLNYRIEQR